MCGIFLSVLKYLKNVGIIINRLNERGPDDIKIKNSKGSYIFTRLAITRKRCFFYAAFK